MHISCLKKNGIYFVPSVRFSRLFPCRIFNSDALNYYSCDSSNFLMEIDNFILKSLWFLQIQYSDNVTSNKG